VIGGDERGKTLSATGIPHRPRRPSVRSTVLATRNLPDQVGVKPLKGTTEPADRHHRPHRHVALEGVTTIH
jgi:hypothetical protein